jgi:hypothetical protein
MVKKLSREPWPCLMPSSPYKLAGFVRTVRVRVNLAAHRLLQMEAAELCDEKADYVFVFQPDLFSIVIGGASIEHDPALDDRPDPTVVLE